MRNGPRCSRLISILAYSVPTISGPNCRPRRCSICGRSASKNNFILLWPAIFLGLVLLVRGRRHRTALAVALAGLIVVSLAWSVIQTKSNATWAYFSPLTRAWELALGALVAVLATVAARVRPSWLTELLSLCGITGIMISALVLNSSTHYPGSAVALPVISTALLIATGCANQRTLVGRALALRPMQWIGARSYSLYLWHWPFLIDRGRIPGQKIKRHPECGPAPIGAGRDSTHLSAHREPCPTLPRPCKAHRTNPGRWRFPDNRHNCDRTMADRRALRWLELANTEQRVENRVANWTATASPKGGRLWAQGRAKATRA